MTLRGDFRYCSVGAHTEAAAGLQRDRERLYHAPRSSMAILTWVPSPLIMPARQ